MPYSDEDADLIKAYKAAEALINIDKSVNELTREFKSVGIDDKGKLTNDRCTASGIDRVIGCTINVIEEPKETDKSIEKVLDSNGTKAEADEKEIEPRNSLLFWGVVSMGKEELISEIVKIVCVYMQVQITREDIRFCYRYGNPTVVAGKESPALVRFQSRYIYSMVWKSRGKLKNTAITVEIHLRMCMRSLFSTARKVFGNHNCFIFDKYIIVKTPDGQAHFLKSRLHLKELSKLWLEKK